MSSQLLHVFVSCHFFNGSQQLEKSNHSELIILQTSTDLHEVQGCAGTFKSDEYCFVSPQYSFLNSWFLIKKSNLPFKFAWIWMFVDQFTSLNPRIMTQKIQKIKCLRSQPTWSARMNCDASLPVLIFTSEQSEDQSVGVHYLTEY